MRGGAKELLRHTGIAAMTLITALPMGCQTTPRATPAGVVLPELISIQAHPDAYLIRDCEDAFEDFDDPPDPSFHAECVLFLDPNGFEDEYGWWWVSEAALQFYIDAIEDQGWGYAHSALTTHYFERAIGAECSEVFVMGELRQIEVAALHDHLFGKTPGARQQWSGLGFYSETFETCGDSRWIR